MTDEQLAALKQDVGELAEQFYEGDFTIDEVMVKLYDRLMLGLDGRTDERPQ